ncbi:hypothetical protein JCM17478_21000 [Thermopirellula anaerolimosa]
MDCESILRQIRDFVRKPSAIHNRRAAFRAFVGALFVLGAFGLTPERPRPSESLPLQKAGLCGEFSVLLGIVQGVFGEDAPGPGSLPPGGGSAENPEGTSPPPQPATPPTPPPRTGPPITGPVVQEAQPEQIYIRDADGNLKLMLGWTMEQFEQLVRIRDGLVQTDSTPRFVINEIQLTGKTEGAVARLTAVISLRVKDAETVRVPLRMGEAVPLSPPEYQGGGEMWIIPNRPGWDYTAYLRGDPAQDHVIRLELLVPVEDLGNERGLSLSLPDAAVSRLQLDIPESPLLATNRGGSGILQVDSLPAGGSRLELVGLGPALKIAWQEDRSKQAEGGTAVEVDGETLVRFGSGKVAFDARLSVKTYGGPLERIVVKLPPECDLVTADGVSTAFRVMQGAQANGAAGGKVVELAAERPVTGPVEIRLTAQRPASEADSPVPLAGFEVLGAVRQTGRIGLVVPNDLLLLWGNSQGVRQVEPKRLVGGAEASFAFEYFGFPFDLSVTPVPRRSHVTVTPRYRLEVGAARTDAEVNLSYEVRGAESSSFAVELYDWVLDEIVPSSVIPPEGIIEKDGVTTFSLQQRVMGKLEVTLKLHRDHRSDEQPLKLSLPSPRADVVVPAELVVIPATNVQWTPRPSECVGLTSLVTGGNGDRGKSAQLFRVQKNPAVLVADWKTHAQEVRAQISTHITVEADRANIEQQIRFQVAYEPRTQPWRLAVPASVPTAGLSVLLDRRRIPLDSSTVIARGDATPTGADGSEDQATPATVIEIPLPAAVLGDSGVSLQYTVALPQDSNAKEGEWVLPLVQPLDATDVRQSLSLQMDDDVAWRQVQPPWSVNDDAILAQDSGGVSFFSATGPVDSVRIAWIRSPSARMVAIDRAWIQTWLDPIGRQERAVFRFRTKLNNVELALPRGTRWEAVQVLLDGKPTQVSAPTPKGLIIPLEAPAEGNRPVTHFLEIWYELPRVDLGWGRQRLEFPRLGPEAYGRNWYWELILPPTEHFLSVGQGWVAEYRWEWQGSGWVRRPSLSEADLEAWIGSATESRQTPLRANRYLFSSLHPVDVSRVLIVRRTWLVTVCSGIVLALGLLWLYAPAVRHPWFAWLLLTVVLGFFAVRADWGVLVAQASAFGAALAVTAWMLQRSLAGPRLEQSGWDVSEERSAADTVVCQAQPRPAEMVAADTKAESAP